MKITRSEQRRNHTDSTHSDYITFRIPAGTLHFVDINNSDKNAKLQDIAHYRYMKAVDKGIENPTVVTYARIVEDRPVAQIFPGLDNYVSEDGEHFLSANSFINYTMRHLFCQGWVRVVDGVLEAAVPTTNPLWQQRGTTVINYLTKCNHIHMKATPGYPPNLPSTPLDINRYLVPVAGCGFLSDFDHNEKPDLIFNTSFFLLEDDDVIHHHCALGEAHGFWMSGGVVERPPLFRRGTIYQTQDGSWHINKLGPEDLAFILPGGLRLIPHMQELAAGAIPYALNEQGANPVTIYSRYYGVEREKRIFGHTPAETDRFELTVIDRRVVGWKENGGLELPHNGLVISFAPGTLSSAAQQALLDTLQTEIRLSYQFVSPHLQKIKQGLQNGPILVQNGRIPLNNDYLLACEQFWPNRILANGDWETGVVPTRYKTDIDSTRSGRVGIGIDPKGDLLVVLAAGVNSGRGVPGKDSFGATLLELAQFLHEAGATNALNLDGGGSTQAYFQNLQTIIPGDRRDPTSQPYERMIPSVGIAIT